MVEQRQGDDSDAERLDRVFHALSDASRRKIVELLREAGELKVGDIASSFDMTLNGVSKHLKVLEQAGLIERRIAGREHWLRVDWSALQLGYEWLHFYQQFWGKRLDALVDYVTTQQTKKPKKKGK
jgi:DNA-binding transcriptional ArsR family regulator